MVEVEYEIWSEYLAGPHTVATVSIDAYVHVNLHADGSVGFELRNDQHPYGIHRADLGDIVRAAIERDAAIALAKEGA